MEVIGIRKQKADSPKYVFYLVMLLIFTDTVLYGTIVPLIPMYTEKFHFTQVQMGAVFAAYSLGLLLLSIPLGIAAERIGYKKVFMAGMLVLIFSSILYGFVNTPLLLFLSRFAQGGAAAASWTAGLAIVSLLYPSRQGEKLGLVMAAMGIGSILGPSIGGILYHYLGYKEMFLFLAIFCLIIFILIYITDFSIVASSRERVSNKNRIFTFKIIKQNPSLLWLSVVVIIISSSFGMLEILVPNHLNTDFSLDTLSIGFLFALMGFVHAFSDAGIGYLSDKYGFSFFVFWGLLLYSLILPFLALSPTVTTFTVILCIVGITLGAAMTPSQPLMYKVVSSDKNFAENSGAGFAYGIFNTCFSIGMFIGPLLGGWLDKNFGFLGGLFIYAGIFFSTAFIFKKTVKPKFE